MINSANAASSKAPTAAAERILVATDFSDCARPAIDYAMMLAARLGARLHLLYVSQVPGVLVGEAVALRDQFVDADIRQGRVQIERLLAELRERGIRADGEVRAGFAPKTIIDEAAPGSYDLVIIGTHGRTGLHRLWTGSVAERVVRSCRIPVLTVRSQPCTPEEGAAR